MFLCGFQCIVQCHIIFVFEGSLSKCLSTCKLTKSARSVEDTACPVHARKFVTLFARAKIKTQIPAFLVTLHHSPPRPCSLHTLKRASWTATAQSLMQEMLSQTQNTLPPPRHIKASTLNTLPPQMLTRQRGMLSILHCAQLATYPCKQSTGCMLSPVHAGTDTLHHLSRLLRHGYSRDQQSGRPFL